MGRHRTAYRLSLVLLFGVLATGCRAPKDPPVPLPSQIPERSERDAISLTELGVLLDMKSERDEALGVHRLVCRGHRASFLAGTRLFTVDGKGYDLSFAPFYIGGELLVPREVVPFLEAEVDEPPLPVAPAHPKKRRPRLRPLAIRHIDLPSGWAVRANRSWNYIVIHHSATSFGGARRFHRNHKRKWRYGLGYHFVVGNGTDTKVGEIEIGPRWRRQNEGIHGAHAGSDRYNQHGIGICVIGNFDKGKPKKKQLAALTKLVEALARRYDIPKKNIRRHAEVRRGGTHCPGKRFPFNSWKRTLHLD